MAGNERVDAEALRVGDRIQFAQPVRRLAPLKGVDPIGLARRLHEEVVTELNKNGVDVGTHSIDAVAEAGDRFVLTFELEVLELEAIFPPGDPRAPRPETPETRTGAQSASVGHAVLLIVSAAGFVLSVAALIATYNLTKDGGERLTILAGRVAETARGASRGLIAVAVIVAIVIAWREFGSKRSLIDGTA